MYAIGVHLCGVERIGHPAVVIIETSIFTRQVENLLQDEEYRKLQAALIGKPDLGQLIKGSGGLRKVRWGLPGRGKSGGVRVIYYWVVDEDQLFMLFMYIKSEQEDLAPAQMKVLKKIVKDEFK
ncbi:MAG: type II toxin-antitoxin system RelE/ParE family toxin [Anaerolineales bacterium]|nr:type II toxin-antitoxin system RelE/ParE family toxin [Anaerolineales bacterium]